METIPFNLTTDDYNVFIQRIREWARAKNPDRFSHGRPVLPYPPQNMRNSEYADLELKAKDSGDERTLIARIRRHDLYIIGYKPERSPKFLEFKWDKKGKIQYIDHSESLGFGENYWHLGDLENQPAVGYTTLKRAIIALATDIVKERRPQLRALAVMVPEVVRFEKMSEILIPEMVKKKDRDFQKWMEPLLHNWTNLSDMLLREDQYAISFRLPKNKDGSPNDLTKDPDLKIVGSADAARCLAILKGNYHPPRQLLASVISPGVADASNNSVQGKGLALVEVFSVRVTNIAGKNPGNLYGSVELFDGLGTFPLYNRQRGESEPISPNDIATLTGPYRGVSGSQFFQVTLDLKNKGTGGPSPDDEVSKGSFAWDVCELTNDGYYDKRLTDIVSGKNGSVTVYYTPFRDAIQARVEVQLVDGGGHNPLDVQGSLVAQYSNYDYSTDEQKKYYRTVLFSKASTVNVGSSLIIEARMSSVNHLHEIAKGTAEFPPQLNGKITKDIRGKYGRIRVAVTWSPQISE
ncbi:hypothetical protein Cgig2_020429 [Carnegiea gigantea]|uniref:rRNA N-glycosylase n=1 Tax=Carnegiea gigantea TaxID=171969 RepID=A0A9Q1Q9F2_9CARY|nr:hypothetical protein Cgig2_020429 [Carnegiea gigantea]